MNAAVLLGWRRPVAVVLICLIAARVVGALLVAVLAAALAPGGTVPAAAFRDGTAALGAADPLPLVVLTTLVVWCAAAGDRSARPIAVAAFSVALSGWLVVIAALVAADPRHGWSSLTGQALDLVLPTLCVIVLGAALRLARHGSAASADSLAGALDPSTADPGVGGSESTDSEPDAAPAPAAPPGATPVWQPDEAAGAVWRTASEAATGAAASEWGRPGEQDEWHRPAPTKEPDPTTDQKSVAPTRDTPRAGE